MEQLEEGAPDKHEEEESIVIISTDMYEKQRNKNVWMIFLRLSWFLRSASQFITSYELIVIECLYKSVFSKTPSTIVLQETRKTIHITNRTSTAKLSEAKLDEAPSRYTMGWLSVSMEPVMTRENGYIEHTSHSHLCFRLQPIGIHINSDVSIAVSLI